MTGADTTDGEGLGMVTGNDCATAEPTLAEMRRSLLLQVKVGYPDTCG